LLEIIFVMAIIVLVMGLGAYSLSDFGEKRAVENAQTELAFLVRQARQVASDTGETVWMVFQKNRFGMLDDKGPDAIAWTEIPDISVRLKRVGEKEWKQPDLFFWEFTPRQLGEPLSVRFTGAQQGGDVALEFSPLSGEGRPIDTARLR
jgi:type II secretory pathway pseudopilin PulG